ncbi:unnamed protein product [Peniophora sp. CBMAI 1063]|nr:unnamed protein product [Peniophora sp. CBMAI 1063]
MRDLTISNVTTRDDLTACYCWTRKGLKITFIACPGLVETPWETLKVASGFPIHVDNSRVAETPELNARIEGPLGEEQPYDDDWAWDGNNSGYEVDDEMEDA